MPEVIIKYKTHKTLEALTHLAKYFDFTLRQAEKDNNKVRNKKSKSLPIDFADDPDLGALAGIWKDKEITLKTLREKAW